jgi:hypothetical protein
MQEIEISYKKGRQVGERPRKIRRGEEFRFISNDPGDLSMEFLNGSPVADQKVKKNVNLKSDKVGRFPFKCTLVQNGKTIVLGDPNDPDSPPGGELEIGPE